MPQGASIAGSAIGSQSGSEPDPVQVRILPRQPKRGTRRETTQLNQNYGTASNRLRRLVMYSLLERLGDTNCFRCGRPMDADTFSIDHRQQWLGDPEQFWDLSNIAFSHKRCNSTARRPGRRTLEAPIGTAWCSIHKAYMPVAEFGPDRHQPNGLAPRCRPCDVRRVTHYKKRQT